MRRAISAGLVLLVSACAVGTAPRRWPPRPPLEGAGATESRKCTHAPDTPHTRDCVSSYPERLRRLGTECALHPGSSLELDTVPVLYGFIGSPLSAERPGVYINSRIALSGGCVIGPPFGRVAYCPQCRRARVWYGLTHFTW